jgi:hypothetical protein
MARERDFRAEYARRVANALRRGLTRSQGRGHARVGELPVRPSAARYDGRFEVALKQYREGRNQADVAKGLNIAPERLRRFLRENVQIEGRGRTRRIIDDRHREMLVLTEGQRRQLIVRGFDEASLVGRHLAAVKSFIDTNDISLLEPFAGRSVIDASGKEHLLETRPNVLHRLASDGEHFPDIYRFVQ